MPKIKLQVFVALAACLLVPTQTPAQEEAEVRHEYTYPAGASYIRVDCETATHVYEGGLDKRSSLDSVQQALFAAHVTGNSCVSNSTAKLSTKAGCARFIRGNKYNARVVRPAAFSSDCPALPVWGPSNVTLEMIVREKHTGRRTGRLPIPRAPGCAGLQFPKNPLTFAPRPAEIGPLWADLGLVFGADRLIRP